MTYIHLEAKMAKVLCVSYDDPVDCPPQTYAQHEMPKAERSPDDQELPIREKIEVKPRQLLQNA